MCSPYMLLILYRNLSMDCLGALMAERTMNDPQRFGSQQPLWAVQLIETEVLVSLSELAALQPALRFPQCRGFPLASRPVTALQC